MRLFSPRKTTLLFVIRDKTKVKISFFTQNIGSSFFSNRYVIAIDILFHEQTPLESLEPILREDIQKVPVI